MSDHDSRGSVPEKKGGGWVQFLITLAIAGLAAYFTALGTIQSRVAVLEERENNHYGQLLALVKEIKDDVKELRQRPAVPRTAGVDTPAPSRATPTPPPDDHLPVFEPTKSVR